MVNRHALIVDSKAMHALVTGERDTAKAMLQIVPVPRPRPFARCKSRGPIALI